MPEPAPPVFISYSHDSDEHRDLVLDLAGRLRRDGIDAIIDQYVQSPPEGWPAWCEAEIRRARFVLMICTEIYLRRVSGEEEPGKGHGVLREARLIRQHLYDAGSVSTKFVPVLFADGSHDHVPTPVKGASIYRIESNEGHEGLYRLLTNQPGVLKPELGKLLQLPERQRVSLGEAPTGTETGEQTRPVAPVARSSYSVIPGIGSVDWRRDPKLADLQVFRDAPFAPEMVVMPAGKFWMGSQEAMSRPSEQPQHLVIIHQRFALGRYPIAFDEYDHFCQLECKEKPKDEGWGRGRMPVINVSRIDVQAYITWLSRETGRTYRLPSEAEWEFACRAGQPSLSRLAINPRHSRQTFPVRASIKPVKLVPTHRIRGVFTTCMATFGNTSRTSGMRIIRARRSTAPHGRRKALLPRSLSASCAVVPGVMTGHGCGRLIGGTGMQAAGTATSVFGWPEASVNSYFVLLTSWVPGEAPVETSSYRPRVRLTAGPRSGSDRNPWRK